MNNSTTSYESLCLKLRELRVDLSPSDKRLISVADFYQDIPEGSHIAVPSHASRLGSWHHGIFMGSKRVMHMYGDNNEEARVRMCSVNDFTSGTNVIALVLYEDDSHMSRQASVLAALFLQDTMKVRDLYEIAGFNCEHFALLCRTGLTRYVTGTRTLSQLFCNGCPRDSRRLSCKFAN